MGRTRWEQRKARIPWRVVTKGSHCLPSLGARNHTKALPWSGKEHQLGIRDSASALCSLPGRLPQLCHKLRWRAGSKAPAALILCASVAPLPCWPWSSAGTHLVLRGWLALLQPDPKCPGGCLLVLLDDVDAPGGFGGGDTVIWGWRRQREQG